MSKKVMELSKISQLEELLSYCSQLDLKIRYDQKNHYFTAIAWCPDRIFPPEETAAAIQRQIQEESTHFPGLVCYCFDPFSTLVYVV